MYAQLENAVADAHHLVQRHARAEHQRADAHRRCLIQDRALASIAGSIDVRDVVAGDIQRPLLGEQRAQGNGESAEQAGHRLRPSRVSVKAPPRRPLAVDK